MGVVVGVGGVVVGLGDVLGRGVAGGSVVVGGDGSSGCGI